MLVEVPLSLKFCVLRFVDHAHATFTEFFEDFVVGIVLPIMADIYATYIFYFLYNDPAIHLSGLGQNWRPMHLIAFSEGAYEQHCPEQVKSLVNDAPPTGLKRIS